MLALAATTSLVACSHLESSPSVESLSAPLVAASNAITPSNAQHLLVQMSYDNGIFKAERASFVPGQLRESRSGKTRGGLEFLARIGQQRLLLGGAPDPRKVNVEYQDPNTQQKKKAAITPAGKQYFLIHVPATTEAIDFFEAANAMAPSSAAKAPFTSAPAPVAATVTAQPVLATVSLKGLL